MEMTWEAARDLIRDVLQRELGTGRYEMASRYEGGKFILQPFDSAQKSKDIPIDVFFKKITSVREKLRVLEQKLNSHPKLTDMEKVELQLYITRAYGSLTTFNVLFADPEDRFVGVKGED
ncbi:MAG: hypothetical protein HYZ00_09830 [Candidatus Hydrogenedentes bacterium]|nr:hypothetical protein [Candidatus Hydrogenedentota bacterium]